MVDARELTYKLADMHVMYAKNFIKAFDLFSISGEDGVMCWLHHTKKTPCPGELSAALGLTTGRIANVLNTLEKKKYIIRTQAGQDRRKVYVALTDAGRSYAAHIYEENLRFYDRIIEKLGERDAEEYVRLVEKLLKK